MNILYMTLDDFDTLNQQGINTDLIREFVKHGHHMYVISPTERRNGIRTRLIRTDGAVILKLRTGNIQKTNLVEKGLSTAAAGAVFQYAVRRYFYGIRFDLVIYLTPPVTFLKAAAYVKKRDGARTYLLLKDIFPQNALDIGILQKHGIRGLIYRYFRSKEQKLYAVSDTIGCMSRANVRYVLRHNPGIPEDKPEVCPNAIAPLKILLTDTERKALRAEYGIAPHSTVFVYGGNLGRPQNIPFVIRCLHACRHLENVFFLIVGNGTEYPLLERYVTCRRPANVKLLQWIPGKEYHRLLGACDVGLLFLDERFTIPNVPSRLLGYMQAAIPVLACTDTCTDVGKIITEGGFGWWCPGNHVERFREAVKEAAACGEGMKAMGEAGLRYLEKNYNVSKAYQIITHKAHYTTIHKS